MKFTKITVLLFLSLHSLTCGSTSATSIVRIDDVFFQFGSNEYAEVSKAYLNINKLVMLMKDHPVLKVEIRGFQDVTEKNIKLLSYYRVKKSF